MGLFGSIASAVASVGSTILGNKSAKQEAQANRDWQEDMSNTSVQRRVEDLKKAGLNPLLAVSSASSGASTPTGAQAQLKHFDPTVVTDMMNSLANSRLINEQAQGQKNENELHGIRKEALKIQNDLMQNKVWTEKLEQGLKLAQTDAERQKILTEAYRRAGIEINNKKIATEAQLLGIELAGVGSTPWGRDVKFGSDVIDDIPSAIGAVGAGALSGIFRLSKFFTNSAKSYFENEKKNYKPRGYDERRISR